MFLPTLPCKLSLILLIYSAAAISQSNQSIEEITVYGSTPLSGNIDGSSLPYAVQSFNSEDFQSTEFTSVADFLNRKANGVTINHAQNNVLQPDVQIRGFAASPLLGAPQGVAVYLNGARINEPFGDTVNWDLITPSIVNSMDLISGSNAVYGLNALGASLALTTKTGFDHGDSTLHLSGGSFGRREWGIETGNENGKWGSYFSVNGFSEDGWRDYSPTDALNAYGALSYRQTNFEWDVFALVADTEMNGNGTSPEQLLAMDREAVFTHPDISENQLAMLSSRGQWQLANKNLLNVIGFYRDNQTNSFNGDGSEFEACDPPFTGFLCDEEDLTDAVEDQFGNNLPENFDAINNISERQQNAWGVTLEYQMAAAFSAKHHSTFGVDLYQGDTTFVSVVEFAELLPNRSTSRSGLLNSEGETGLTAKIRNLGVYWADRIDWSDKMVVNLSLRYNYSAIKTLDQSGANPELNASHTYGQLNWGLGAIYHVSNTIDLVANIDQSSRTPSPVELACSHPNAPCTLPNTFLADPPLDEVIARTLEFGVRQQFSDALYWEINTFLTRINDDIVFQSTGGVSSNEGFFSNASNTQRLGFASLLSGSFDKFDWQIAYSWLQATFEDNFFVSSPNHPLALNDQIAVNQGDSLPGLPEHSLRISGDWKLTEKWLWSLESQYQSGVYLRGDEGNLDQKTDSFLTFNSTLNFQASETLKIYLAVTNLFDAEYETFGLYGEPDEVIPSLGDENTRFISPSEPRGAWLGLRYIF